MADLSKNRLNNIKGKICALIVIVIFFSILFHYLDKTRTEELAYIKADHKLTKGMILNISNHKGHSIKIEYRVDNKKYIETDGFTDFGDFEVGDSISVLYSPKKPDLMICEINENFWKIVSKAD